MLTTLDLWKNRGIGLDVFYIETIPRDHDRQRSTKRARSISLPIIFNFGKSILNVWSLNHSLHVGNSPGAMHHKVLN
jgi:hypothetical protein